MKTVLVIEDKHIVQAAIRDWLEEEGFRTLGAANGKIGLELIQSQRPDLILCDVVMPVMDGYQVLMQLRQDPSTTTIPFVFLTVKGSNADWRYGMELGADDYLVKPCTAKELINAVTSRLEKQALLQSQMQSESQQQLETLRHSIAFSLPQEFRTPSTGILTGLELLRLSADRPSEVLELANSIEECTDLLYGLVKKFLLYTELEIRARDPQQGIDLQPQDIWQPLSVIYQVAEQVASRYGRSADLQLKLMPTQIFLPEERLRNVIEELLDNACKFSEVGLPIQVLGELQQERSSSDCATYLIRVTNLGSGLTPQQIAAFGAYVQFDRCYYEQQGSGLGLSIARRIVELYGGQFKLTSVPGQETTVEIILPAAQG